MPSVLHNFLFGAIYSIRTCMKLSHIPLSTYARSQIAHRWWPPLPFPFHENLGWQVMSQPYNAFIVVSRSRQPSTLRYCSVQSEVLGYFSCVIHSWISSGGCPRWHHQSTPTSRVNQGVWCLASCSPDFQLGAENGRQHCASCGGAPHGLFPVSSPHLPALWSRCGPTGYPWPQL